MELVHIYLKIYITIITGTVLISLHSFFWYLSLLDPDPHTGIECGSMRIRIHIPGLKCIFNSIIFHLIYSL